METPRDDLIRSTPSAVSQMVFREDPSVDEGDASDGRTMTGYPIVFNQWTEIDSYWEGHFLERIAPAALNRTLSQRSDKVVVAFNHGYDPQIGDKPLGKPSVMEPRDFGMWAEVPLSRTSYNDDLLELIRDGALWGQSFRFTVLDERWIDEPDPSDANPKGLPERTIHEIRLYEFGPVTYPAYEATTLGIRSAEGYRSWLRDRGTVSDKAPVQEDTADNSSPLKAPVAKVRNIRLTMHGIDRAMGETKRLLEGSFYEAATRDPRSNGRDQRAAG